MLGGWILTAPEFSDPSNIIAGREDFLLWTTVMPCKDDTHLARTTRSMLAWQTGWESGLTPVE